MKQLLVMLAGLWFVSVAQATLPASDSQGQVIANLGADAGNSDAGGG